MPNVKKIRGFKLTRNPLGHLGLLWDDLYLYSCNSNPEPVSIIMPDFVAFVNSCIDITIVTVT